MKVSGVMNELETNGQERDRKRRSICVRSMRRGMRELDILIGGFVEERLESLSDEELDDLEALLFETDVAVLDWIVGASDCPERYLGLVAAIREVAEERASGR